jgi:ribosomal protein S18 acetylase RimI-like enzyme
MKFKKTVNTSKVIKFELMEAGKQAARGFLYLVKNDLHKQPYGFLEDIFVSESLRGQGIGTQLIGELIKEAKKQKCYKIIATSRNSNKGAHKLYTKLGLKKHGVEFRIDFM